MKIVATVLAFENQYGVDHVLNCLAQQDRSPDSIVVIDNGSRVPLRPTMNAQVYWLRMEANLGVGAGHNKAVSFAFNVLGADAVWILEHDSFPEPECLSFLLAGNDLLENLHVLVPRGERNRYEAANQFSGAEDRLLEQITFNGPLLSRKLWQICGPIREDLFVGHEDWEFSRVIGDHGSNIVQISNAILIHANKGLGRYPRFVSIDRYYFSSRNSVAIAREAGEKRSLVFVREGLLATISQIFRRGRGLRLAIASFRAQRDGWLGLLERGYSSGKYIKQA